MGNFGKRLLIVGLSIIAVVALAITGNAIQQADRTHKVSSSNEVVYTDGSLSVTKGDIWSGIVNSQMLDIVLEYLNNEYVNQIIEKYNANDEFNKLVNEKVNDITYGVGKTKDDYSATEQAKYETQLVNKLSAMGYFDDQTTTTKNEAAINYAQNLVATDLLTKYFIDNNKSVGSYSYDDLSKDKITESLKYNDSFALVTIFRSSEEAKNFIKNNIVGDEFPLLLKETSSSTTEKTYQFLKFNNHIENKAPFVGRGINVSNNTNYGSNYGYTKVYLVDSNDPSGTEYDIKVTETYIIKDDADNKVYNVYLVEKYEENLNDVSKSLYTYMYLDSENTSKSSDSTKISANLSKFNEKYNDGSLDPIDTIPYLEYDKEFFDDSYYNDFGEELTDEEMFNFYKAVYNKYYETLIEYELKESFNFELNKESFKDKELKEGYTFDSATNTILNSENEEISFSEYLDLYTFCFNGSDDFKFTDSFKYNYKELNSSNSTLASDIFVNLSTATSFYNETVKVTSSEGVDSPYYFVYKLASTDTNIDEDSDLFKNAKDELIKNLMSNSYFVQMMLAELRKQSEIKFNDSYLVYEYEDLLAYSSSGNTYGLKDDKAISKYFKKGSYNSSRVLRYKPLNIELSDTELKVTNISLSSKKYTNLTVDSLYDFAVTRHGASYIANQLLSKSLVNLDDFVILHGEPINKINYLTSKNERVITYRETCEYYNSLYEYMKQNPSMSSYYGMGTYESSKDFIYSYIGFRDWNHFVEALMRQSVKTLFMYGNLINDDFSKNDVNSFKSGVYNKYFNNQDTSVGLNLEKIYNDQFDIVIDHVLISVDLDQNGTYDSLDSFKKDHSELKETYDKAANNLFFDIMNYINNKGSMNKDDFSLLDDFNKDYNSKDEYQSYRALGLIVKHESLGEVDETSVSNYVENFKNEVLNIKDLIENDSMNKTMGYMIDDELTETDFGYHMIFARESEAEITEINLETLEKDLVKYIRSLIFAELFGTTDNPLEKAKKVYSSIEEVELDNETYTNIDTLYGERIKAVIDSGASYSSIILMLNSMNSNQNLNSNIKAQVEPLIKAYQYALFQE